MSVVLGVDPSLTCTGVAMVEFGPVLDGCEPLRWETWRARWRGETPADVAQERRRIRHLLMDILAVVPRRVDLSVIEGPAPHAKFRGKPDEMGGLRWMLIDQLLARGPVVAIDPMTRALIATGYGRSSKDSVLAQVRADFPGVHVPDHNVADAVALAGAGAAQLGLPVPYRADQVRAHAKVAWPVEGELVLAEQGKS
ncbi:hypothetical protein K8F61_05330 [Microbacterium resistens]|uniref:Holliday junction nuclease RuvC n=1 Tax=Microbacterium resistens TaxID=156977 RepID=A0ABY3RUU8_9MICO|nr:hypothetical protein [Microbacterium resistens]UGS27612.1 hypothetical protein K8F61_05330 [Microbacterium resistens]